MVTLAGVSLELVRKDIKNLHLAVYPPDGRVRLSAPRYVDEETLSLFVASKVPWIRKKQRAIEEQPRQTPREFVDRESHYFMGRRYLMRVHEIAPPRRFATAELGGKKFLDVHVSETTSLEQKKRAVEKFYRAELRTVLEELVPLWEERMKVESSGWRIRPMKTKWGSCNTLRKTMLFNLELIKQPIECIEYVVVHELAHLIERGHGPRFQAVLDAHMPGWRHLQAKLHELPAL